MFLHLNGHRLTATQADATLVMLALAAGELSEADFAAWLRTHSAPA
jgi:death-on-curing protein